MAKRKVTTRKTETTKPARGRKPAAAAARSTGGRRRIRAASVAVESLVALNLGSSPTTSNLKPEAPPVVEAQPATYIDRGLPLPNSYGMDRLVVLVRDPDYIFTYWELTGGRLAQIRNERGQAFIDSCAWVLRLYRLHEDTAVDVEIDPSIGNWYWHVGGPGRYACELALLSPDGEWILLVASHAVETPRKSPSDIIDEEWRMRPEDEEALFEWLRKSLPDAARRGVSGFIGASQMLSSRGLTPLGSSASGRPLGSSWVSSFMGASRSGSGSGGFGWITTPAGLEPALDRPQTNGGPNWNGQPNLPVNKGKTQQPNFKVKLPRKVHNVKPPAPSWPPTQSPSVAVTNRRLKAEKAARA